MLTGDSEAAASVVHGKVNLKTLKFTDDEYNRLFPLYDKCDVLKHFSSEKLMYMHGVFPNKKSK